MVSLIPMTMNLDCLCVDGDDVIGDNGHVNDDSKGDDGDDEGFKDHKDEDSYNIGVS